MADIVEFPKDKLTIEERKRLEEFMRQEATDIQDTACNSLDELKDEILILAEYFAKFMEVVEDPDSVIYPDYDFSLSLLEGRIKED